MKKVRKYIPKVYSEEIIDTDEYIVCRICKLRIRRLTNIHTKVHNITTIEYKEMFPDAPLICKGLSQVFRNKWIGKNNINHKSKTTEEQRKSRSPFSTTFVKYENLSEEEKDSKLKEFNENILTYRLSTSQLQYWINKGFSEEESIEKVKLRQTTFSLDICIEKYGEEEGRKVWQERQNKWNKSLIDGGKLKGGYSKISQELFNNIIKYYPSNELDNVYFFTKNNEIRLNSNTNMYLYDFTDIKRMKIIEFQGDIYHCLLYTSPSPRD